MKTTRPIFPVPALSFTTPRLLLRPYLPSDADDLFLLRSQPEVMKWTSSRIPDSDICVTLEWMAPALPPNNASTFRFVIEEKANPGIVIGALGGRFAEPPECGYMLRKEMWGKGYATESLKAWLDVYWALPRRVVDLDIEKSDTSGRLEQVPETLLAETDTANTGSRHVLLKCGFKELRAFEEEGFPLVHYVYTRPF